MNAPARQAVGSVLLGDCSGVIQRFLESLVGLTPLDAPRLGHSPRAIRQHDLKDLFRNARFHFLRSVAAYGPFVTNRRDRTLDIVDVVW